MRDAAAAGPGAGRARTSPRSAPAADALRAADASTVDDASPPDILRALDEEHKYQARLLNLMEKQVGLLNQHLPSDLEAMHGVMRYMTQYPDRFHHPKEDLLFEKIALRDPAARARVQEMIQAHATIVDRGAELLELIARHRDGAGDVDANRLRKSAHGYIGALRRHMDVENLHLFPLAARVLQPADWIDVDRRMKPILDPVFGAQPAADFDRLREAEAALPEVLPPGLLAAGLIEAAALIEAASALIAAASRTRGVLAQHNRDVLRVHRDLLNRWLQPLPLDERLDLVGGLFQRHLSMLSAVNSRIVELWSGVGSAMFGPYEQAEGQYAPKLLRLRAKGRAAAAGPKAGVRRRAD